MPRSSRDAERGGALLATIFAAVAAAALAAAAASIAREAAHELRARADGLCAAYGAQSAFALGPSRSARLASSVDPRLTSLTLVRTVRAPGWCVEIARARCGQATRTLERTVAAVDCGALPPGARSARLLRDAGHGD